MLQEYQNGVNSKKNQILAIILYPICLIVFAAIALLTFSDSEPEGSFLRRSEFFYIRLIWFEILFSCAWFAGCIGPIGNMLKYRQQTGGGYAVMAATVLNVAVLSMLILFFSLFFPRSRFFDILPIVIQIIIFIACLVKLVCLKYAQAWQMDGLNIIPTTIKTPEQLIAMLLICEQQSIVVNNFSVTVKRIKEKIKYSIPQAGKVSSSDAYKDLTILVETFYNKLMDGKYDDISSDISIIEKKIISVIADCKY